MLCALSGWSTGALRLPGPRFTELATCPLAARQNRALTKRPEMREISPLALRGSQIGFLPQRLKAQ